MVGEVAKVYLAFTANENLNELQNCVLTSRVQVGSGEKWHREMLANLPHSNGLMKTMIDGGKLPRGRQRTRPATHGTASGAPFANVRPRCARRWSLTGRLKEPTKSLVFFFF